jgi:hypothetical protein
MRARGRGVSYNQSMRTGQSLLGKSRRRFYFLRSPLAICALFTLLIVTVVHWGDVAKGQSQNPMPTFPPAPGQNTGRPQLGQESDVGPDPTLRRTQEEAAKKRNIDRQKKIRADSEKIVELALELNTSVQSEPGNPASSAMAKKADEIGKLAHSVRELMKYE